MNHCLFCEQGMKIYVALKSLCFVYEKGEFTFGRGGLGQYR